MPRLVVIAISFFCVDCLSATAAGLSVSPAQVQLNRRFERLQLLVNQQENTNDVTRDANYESSNRQVVEVSDAGQLLAIGNGQATITVSLHDMSQSIPITVSGVDTTEFEFTNDIQPILDKLSCATAACHASQHGKGGFKLSVFGFDPAGDYDAIARASRSRRINFASVDTSVILQKSSNRVPHGGGQRLHLDSVEYRIFKAWISSGAPAPVKDAPSVESMVVTPQRRVGQMGATQQLRVEVHYSDGRVRDVTALAKYDSMDEGVLNVDRGGLVTSVGKGQSAIMVRYGDQAEISTFVIPYSDSVELAGWSNNNFIDEHAKAKFRELGLEPSALCDDATFVRRAFLDAIGGLPTVEETRAYIESTDPKKREQLIDRLLGLTGDPALDIYNDRYAAYWTLKWSDLIRNNSKTVGEQGMWALYNWIRESFRTNRPFDEFVSEMVTAKGSIYMNGPANYFRINTNSSTLTEATAQLFLGVRLECAKCHHHPFEKYSQADYYGLAAFFSRVGSKNSEEFGLFGRESVVIVRTSGEVSHPKTGKRMIPTPLDGEPIDDPLDRRIPLAKWLTSKDNELFARSVVNRYIGYFMGRGLVEPIDDMRSTNPPSNVPMMDALAKDFADNDFDLKHLIRAIMTSRVYQLSSNATPSNEADYRFYSHYRVKRILAEPLLDAIDQVTGVQTKFKSLPVGTRAIDLPDAEYPNLFLKTFAKPRRASVCECERSPDENLAQALHTLNGEILAKKIADKNGIVTKLIQEEKPHEEIVRELYLTALCRLPSQAEVDLSHEFLKEITEPQQCYEDLLWALINSKQFLFVR